MEARQTYSGSAVPRGLAVLLAISVAIALAMAAGVLAKNFAHSNAAVNSAVHPAPGTVLRQDNPVQAVPASIHGAPAGTHNGRSSGTQSVEGAGSTTAPAAAPDLDDRPHYRE